MNNTKLPSKQNLEMFTTKQVAEQLNTSSKVVLNNAKKCLKNKVFENGKTTYYTKAEVTMIIEQMKKSNSNQSTFTGAVKAVSTELTPSLRMIEAMKMFEAAAKEEISRLKEEKNSLQIELDQSKEWYSIKRMEMLNPGMTFNWRMLKAESEKMGIDRKDVFDANYGEVKAYHKDVWESLYFDNLNY